MVSAAGPPGTFFGGKTAEHTNNVSPAEQCLAGLTV